MYISIEVSPMEWSKWDLGQHWSGPENKNMGDGKPHCNSSLTSSWKNGYLMVMFLWYE